MTQDNTLGAAWMREQAAIACNVVAAEAKEYNIPQMSLGASACCEAIRAIPLPTDADALAEAMKLPEVAAQVDAANMVDDEYGGQPYGPALTSIDSLRTALAPFTAAKERP